MQKVLRIAFKPEKSEEALTSSLARFSKTVSGDSSAAQRIQALMLVVRWPFLTVRAHDHGPASGREANQIFEPPLTTSANDFAGKVRASQLLASNLGQGAPVATG